MVTFYVDDIPITIEDKFAKKLDVMCERVMKDHPTLDACLSNSGFEGEGKTGVSIIEAAYIKIKTGRQIYLHIKTSGAAKSMQDTEKGIHILDEPSFETLSADALTAKSKDLLRLTSTMRVKRHFLIVNFAKFWKFPEFLVVDRALGMVHLYSRQGKEPGRFFYIRKKNLERLWNDYKKKGERNFYKYKSFGGKFPWVMDKIFNKLDINVDGKPHATIEDYNEAKDLAIASIGQVKSKKESKAEQDLRRFRILIANLKRMPGFESGTDAKIANHFKVSTRTIKEWRTMEEDASKVQDSDENGGLKGDVIDLEDDEEDIDITLRDEKDDSGSGPLDKDL